MVQPFDYRSLTAANFRIAELEAELQALREATTECDGYNCCPLAPELKALREARALAADTPIDRWHMEVKDE